jgi:flagellar FliJ protein
MKRFQFKLESVLQLRNQRERKVVNEHAQVLREVDQLREAMDELHEGLRLEHYRYQQSLSQPQSVSTMKHLRSGCDYYEQRLREVKQQLDQAEFELERRKAALTEARQEREMIEKYRDRLAGVHAHHVAKADQHFLDELSVRGVVHTT